MDTHLGHDGVDQFTLRQGEVWIMVVGENVAKKQRHPDLHEGGHAGAHDPHSSPHSTPTKVLPWNAQQMADSLLIEVEGLTPPLAELATLAFFQDQWMPQKFIDGIFIEGNPLAPHPGALASDSFFCRPGVSIKLHDYLWIKLGHGWYELSPLPSGYLLLELSILLVSQLDSPLSEEQLAFNGFKSSLVIRTPELVSIKVHICLWAALEPSPVASFLDLLAGSFLGAISCKDAFAKLVYKK